MAGWGSARARRTVPSGVFVRSSVGEIVTEEVGDGFAVPGAAGTAERGPAADHQKASALLGDEVDDPGVLLGGEAVARIVAEEQEVVSGEVGAGFGDSFGGEHAGDGEGGLKRALEVGGAGAFAEEEQPGFTQS